MIDAHFSTALRSVITDWRSPLTPAQAIEQLDDPVSLGQSLLPAIDAELAKLGCARADVKNYAWRNPYLCLRNAFNPADIPETPIDFRPVPNTEGTLLARATVIVCLAALDSDTVSYGSENGGDLFVNLVVIPGEGRVSEKSQDKMSGHTDGVSFPVRGHRDPGNPRIAPSPDFVCLSALRNPKGVPTTVMPLDVVLDHLDDEDILELQKPQYILQSQITFRDGMEEILGEELMVDDAQLLFMMQGKWWIRYSHSSTKPADSGQTPAKRAMEALKEACKQCVIPVALVPGDIAIVNNRMSLHGRTKVGEEHGAETRWMLRTYGLDTSELDVLQRHPGSPFMLFP
ncbi:MULTISPECIES: TauD/TfdA family dioxygenase [unclassified Pseudomonas]|uniref:TauD/TfdA family dioxygenase n=1 Tax=unclassified Pseudomonas TaxID=196821 RepID=UPI001FF0ACDF|nr:MULTISPECIES: TauD/TfdA family dioxygenase [unclassified Pseudomonas]